MFFQFNIISFQNYYLAIDAFLENAYRKKKKKKFRNILTRLIFCPTLFTLQLSSVTPLYHSVKPPVMPLEQSVTPLAPPVAPLAPPVSEEWQFLLRLLFRRKKNTSEIATREPRAPPMMPSSVGRAPFV